MTDDLDVTWDILVPKLSLNDGICNFAVLNVSLDVSRTVSLWIPVCGTANLHPHILALALCGLYVTRQDH